METIGNPGLWGGFAAVVLIMLAIDLFTVGGGKEHRVSFKEAATWSAIWICVTLAFTGGLWWYLDGSFGREIANTKALEFITGYLIEKALAVDNVFIWLMLFSHFAITTDPFIVLTSNVFAILGLRAMYFLLTGVADRFSLVKYGLAVVLMFIGVKMLLIDVYKIPVGFSLALVAVIIGVSVWASLHKEAWEKKS